MSPPAPPDPDAAQSPPIETRSTWPEIRMTDSAPFPTVPITSVPRTAMAVFPARTRMLRGLALAIFPDTKRKAPFLITTPTPPVLLRGSKTNSSRIRRAPSPIEKVVPSRNRICARTPSPVMISSSKKTLLPTASVRIVPPSAPIGPAVTSPLAAARTPDTGRSVPPAITGDTSEARSTSMMARMPVGRHIPAPLLRHDGTRPNPAIDTIMLEHRFQPDGSLRPFATAVRNVRFRAG